MKKMKSLVAAFTLAAAGVMTMGASPAQAQTVPVNGGQVWNEQMPAPATSAYVSQAAIDNLAYNVGVQTAYYRAGLGFTQGTADTGENIGLEFRLNGPNASVIRAYNLDDPNSLAQFQGEINAAYANDRALADQEYASPGSYPYYAPDAYVICPSPVAVVGIGWGITGWFPGYVPVYTPWYGFWDGGHRIHRDWDDGGWGRGYDRGHWAGGEDHGYRGGDHGYRGGDQWHRGGDRGGHQGGNNYYNNNNGYNNHVERGNGGNWAGHGNEAGGRRNVAPVTSQPRFGANNNVRQPFNGVARQPFGARNNVAAPQAPRMEAPRIQAPRMQAPRVQPNYRAPVQRGGFGGGFRGGIRGGAGGFHRR